MINPLRWPGAILAALPPRAASGGVASYGSAPGLDGLGIGADWDSGGGLPPTLLATAFAVIKLLSGTCASLPRRVHERSDLNRRERRDPEFEHLWGRPTRSRSTNAIAWWEMLFASLEGWANSYPWVSRVPGTQGWRGVDGLYFLPPGRVMPGEDANREKAFAIGQDRERHYGPNEVLHIMGLSFDGIRGIGPVRAGPGAHDLALQAERFGRVFFANGTRLSGVVMTEAAYNEETAKEFMENWSAMHSGAGNVGSIGAGRSRAYENRGGWRAGRQVGFVRRGRLGCSQHRARSCRAYEKRVVRQAGRLIGPTEGDLVVRRSNFSFERSQRERAGPRNAPALTPVPRSSRADDSPSSRAAGTRMASFTVDAARATRCAGLNPAIAGLSSGIA